MNFIDEFDIILCMNVLEHVFDFKKAIDNIYKALKPGGTALIFVPGFYPYMMSPVTIGGFQNILCAKY